ncbi:MAG: SGNH/GDSL hydrolase family protein [Myxococcales bacterium]|nr:MAG: SGNH/GDSL hydrolase family protein [Myxococcales bacterium]
MSHDYRCSLATSSTQSPAARGTRARLQGMRRLLAGLLLFTVAGCASAPESTPTTSASPAAAPQISYAALGDSYTAAPYVISTDLADGCLRSQQNYPRLVADALDADLTDVSCGGADTSDVTAPQRTMGSGVRPPQIKAVTRDTDLVTVGLGGNDGNLFGQLVGGCPLTGPQGETFGHSGRCGHMPDGVTDRLITGTQRDLTRALELVQRTAPKATVVLIGYSRLLGAAPCAELPVAQEDLAGAAAVAVRLRDAQRDAAATAGVGFLDMHRLSAGHDACSKQPWVQGIHTDQTQGAAMHPTPAGQEAVAQALRDHLTEVGFGTGAAR